MTDIQEKIKEMIVKHPVMLFMKGEKEEPMCGFSAQVVQILNELNVSFHHTNVLEDWEVRDGIKSFSNWPTIPQLYINGEFVGGCDIVMEMHRRGELLKMLQAHQH